MRWFALMLGVVLLGGCAARPVVLELGKPAEDFAFSLIVLPIAIEPIQFKPAVYIVEPDRTLRVAVGEGVAELSYPAPARVLTHSEFARIWNLALESGLLDLERGLEEVETEAFRAWYARHGMRRQVSFGPYEAADLQPLFEELERLAWLRK